MLQNVYEIILPRCRAGSSGTKEVNEETTRGKSDEAILKMKIHSEYNKANYDEGEINGVVDEYMEINVQFGYLALFSVAFALIPLIAICNNMIEIVIDRKKLINYTRRPLQLSAKNNGIFTLNLEVVAFWAIFTNLGIICFTIEAFGSGEDRYIGFLWTNVGFYILRFILQELIPDESEFTYNIRMRHKIIVERTLARFNRPDDNVDDEEVKSEEDSKDEFDDPAPDWLKRLSTDKDMDGNIDDEEE